MSDASGHEPESASAVLVSATLPEVALMAIVPTASGVGRSVTAVSLGWLSNHLNPSRRASGLC